MGVMKDTHRFIRLLVNHTGTGEDFTYVDIAKELSAINRRFYRQGRTYHVANATVHDTSGNVFVKFCTVPNTWTTRRAWQRGLQAFLNMHERAAGTEWQSLQSKYFDFKVYFSNDHISDVDKPHFKDTENNQIQFGDWDYSAFFSPDGTTGADMTNVHIMGDSVGTIGNWSSVSLLRLFEEIIKQPTAEPTLDVGVEDNFYMNMFDDGTTHDEIIEQAVDDNDMPPYYAYTVPGGADGGTENAKEGWVVRETALDSTNASIAHVGGFPVPCGLLLIETKSTDADNVIEVLLEIVPGRYKGVQAERMGKASVNSKREWKVR